METLIHRDRLVFDVAHDINSVLNAILCYGALAQESTAVGSPVRRYVDNMMQAVIRVKGLVERLREVGGGSIGEQVPVKVQPVIEEILELLTASLPSGVRLQKRLCARDATVLADATQLHRLGMNLCTNALDAIVDGGVLEVLLEHAQVREPCRLSHGELQAGSYLRLVVRDTGVGIKPRLLDRVFDPFFTTKGRAHGTGLGLAIVQSIVTDIRGAIDVASARGQGTTFTIWMPVAESSCHRSMTTSPIGCEQQTRTLPSAGFSRGSGA